MAAAEAQHIARAFPAEHPLFILYTSGTTGKPKGILHTSAGYLTQASFTHRHVFDLKPESDVYWCTADIGWITGHSYIVYGPMANGATQVMHEGTFDTPTPERPWQIVERYGVTIFYTAPTAIRMFMKLGAEVLQDYELETLRVIAVAGEPLNPEIIDCVRNAWGLTLRDGYGQTETTAQIGNAPGQPIKAGSMGRPLPGYRIELLDADGNLGDEGEVCIDLRHRPVGLMSGYEDSAERTAEAMRGGFYRTGDVAARDADGYITFVGRADDVFKASDYRLSPFELESVLIEHEAVAEAAVVPSPDPVRLAVPKAYVVLTAGWRPDADTAKDILRFCRENLAPYKRIRRIEFTELPKTISGKIRRVELRARERELHPFEGGTTVEHQEWADTDFPDLKG